MKNEIIIIMKIFLQIEKNPIKRLSALLGCYRFKGVHNFEVIADILEKIYEEYGLTDKIISTVTDNGSNFVKAFEEFSDPSAFGNFFF